MRPEALLGEALASGFVCAVLATVTPAHSFASYRTLGARPAPVTYRLRIIRIAAWHALRIHAHARSDKSRTRVAATLLSTPTIAARPHAIARLLSAIIRVCPVTVRLPALLTGCIHHEVWVSADAGKDRAN